MTSRGRLLMRSLRAAGGDMDATSERASLDHAQRVARSAWGELGDAPLVLAIAPEWRADGASDALEALRAELRGLGASLVIATRAGAWTFRAEDDRERFVAGAGHLDAELARLVDAGEPA